LAVPLQAASFLENGLRLFLVVPEFRLSYFLFKLENFRAFPFGIKDNL
jgi:hypothetical protein